MHPLTAGPGHRETAAHGVRQTGEAPPTGSPPSPADASGGIGPSASSTPGSPAKHPPRSSTPGSGAPVPSVPTRSKSSGVSSGSCLSIVNRGGARDLQRSEPTSRARRFVGMDRGAGRGVASGRVGSGRVGSKALLGHSEVGHRCRFAPIASLGLIGRLKGRFSARLLRGIRRFDTVPADLEHEPS